MSDHSQNFQTAWHVAELVYSFCYHTSICLYRVSILICSSLLSLIEKYFSLQQKKYAEVVKQSYVNRLPQ